MTKAELKELLDSKEIAYEDDATNAELEALVPVEEEVEDEEEVIEEEVSGDVAVVDWKGRTREYSKEIHGKDFKKLAEQFAGKESVGGTVTMQ